MFLLDPTDRTLPLMILTTVSQLLFSKLPLLTTSTATTTTTTTNSTTTTTNTTTMFNQLRLPTLTGTHSSTLTTQPTLTSSTIPMLPITPLETLTPNRLTVSQLVLIVVEPTPSSTHMTPHIKQDTFSLSNLPPLHSSTTTTISTTTTTSTTTMPTKPPRLHTDFSLLENFL